MKHEVRDKILSILLEHMEEGVHVIDENGITLAYNKAMEEIEGLVPSEVIGKPFKELFPNLDENNSTLLRAIKHNEGVEKHRQDYVNLKGQPISTINYTYPIWVEGKLRGALEISSNISDVRELSTKLVKLDEQEHRVEHRPNYYTFDAIIGKSVMIKEAIAIAEKCARTDASVLIIGDTGTGKEMFAQSIHNGSKRARKPFIAINCGSLPESLLESLLFGTVKGAFTGSADTKGFFEQAHTGTMFLDEINSMSMNLQSKLLRVLQEGFIRKVGGAKDIRVDVRIIAATNQSPQKQIEDGSLRRDLYYRLNVMRLDLPGLNQRPGDIELLSYFFLEKYAAKSGIAIEDISPELMKLLRQRTYRGNVRELENLIESAINLKGAPGVLDVGDMPDHFFMEVDDKLLGLYNEDEPLVEYLEKIEKNLIQAAFYKEKGNVTNTAKRLGLPRQNLHYKLKKYKIQ